jgi:hypothetical protein
LKINEEKTEANALATYLIGLALLQQNQRTHVNREIAEVVAKLQTEFNLKN